MNDPSGRARTDAIADLQRWIAQERAEGRQRAFVDAALVERVAASSAAEVGSRRVHAAGSAAGPTQPAPADSAENAALPRAFVRREPSIIAHKAAALAELDAQQVSVCTKCALHETRTRTVFGVGHPDADLMFVGEAPGADEDRRGEPFVGRAGQLLTKILQAAGFEREDVFIANVLKCRPPGNRDPLPDEVAHCEPYLLKQIEIIEPKIICALGRIAAQTLLQTKKSLTHLRGQVHDYHGVMMLVTYHPAALLRNPNWKRPTWDDIRRMRKLYDELAEPPGS